MPTKDERYGEAIAYLNAGCAAHGLASIGFDDGQMFMITRRKLLEMIETMDRKGSDEFLIFIQRGPTYEGKG